MPPDILVLCKRYDRETISITNKLRSSGTRIILDLCDNHFYYENPSLLWINRANDLRFAIKNCDAIVVSTHTLAEIVFSECSPKNLFVIGDAVEFESVDINHSNFFKHPIAEINLKYLQLFFQFTKSNKKIRLLWFGNHGSGNSAGGMLDLLNITESLKILSLNFNASLTIISNSWIKFSYIRKKLPIHCNYLSWNINTFSRAAVLHDIAIIPVTLNDFTKCKSNNRLVTALSLGLAVVADPVPSYEEFNTSVRLGNWTQNLIELAGNESIRSQSVEIGRNHLIKYWLLPTIVDKWYAMLSNIHNL